MTEVSVTAEDGMVKDAPGVRAEIHKLDGVATVPSDWAVRKIRELANRGGVVPMATKLAT